MFSRLLYSSMSIALANVIVRGSILLLSIYSTHVLLVSELAIFTNNLILMQVISGLALAGLSNIIIKEVAKRNGNTGFVAFVRNIAALIFILSCFFGLVFYLVSIFLFPSDSGSMNNFLFSFCLIISTINLGLLAVVQGLLDFKVYLLSAICFMISMMLMLLLSSIVKLPNPIFFLIISNIFSVCYVTFKLKRFFYGSFSFFNFQRLESITFLKNSLPMFASALLVMPVMFYGNYLLSSSASLDDSVVYNLAFQWRNIVSIVPAAMLQAFLPLIVKSKGSARFSYHMLVIFISSLFLILLLSFILIGKIDFIYGDVVSGYTSVFYYMILSSVLASFSALFGQYFFANGNYKMCFLMNLVWAIIFLLLLEYVELNAESVALSLALSYLVLFFFQLLLYFLKGKKYGFA